MKKKVVIFLDKVLPKNYSQLEFITKNGFEPALFLNDAQSELPYTSVFKLEQGFYKRFSQVFSFFKQHKHNIHHIEAYPGGRFSFVYFLLASFFKLRTICVERGDILYYRPVSEGGYSRMTRLSMFLCYKFADIVWYREPYMLEKLQKMGVKNLFFIHNTVAAKEALPASGRNIDFLWVNRVIPERRADWFVNNLDTEAFKHTNNVLLGLLNEKSIFPESEKYVTERPLPHLHLQDYIPPVDFYKRARFFVLPATIVFANNSLLEAMSYGVVPLISHTISSHLLVNDGVDGFIFEHTEASFLEAMNKAIQMTEAEYEKMSDNVLKKIKDEFSIAYYYRELEKLYRQTEQIK